MAQSEEVVFRCVSCPAILTNVKELNKHYNRCHAALENSMFGSYCVVCGFTYTKKGHLHNHMRKQHPGYRYNERTNTVSSVFLGSNVQEKNGVEGFVNVAGPSGEHDPGSPSSHAEVVDLEVKADSADTERVEHVNPKEGKMLVESILLCIENQQMKIKEMEGVVASHEEEVVKLKRDIKDHEVIVETLKRDLESARNPKSSSSTTSSTSSSGK